MRSFFLWIPDFAPPDHAKFHALPKWPEMGSGNWKMKFSGMGLPGVEKLNGPRGILFHLSRACQLPYSEKSEKCQKPNLLNIFPIYSLLIPLRAAYGVHTSVWNLPFVQGLLWISRPGNVNADIVRFRYVSGWQTTPRKIRRHETAFCPKYICDFPPSNMCVHIYIYIYTSFFSVSFCNVLLTCLQV